MQVFQLACICPERHFQCHRISCSFSRAKPLWEIQRAEEITRSSTQLQLSIAVWWRLHQVHHKAIKNRHPQPKKKQTLLFTLLFQSPLLCLLQNYMNPLKLVLTPQDMEAIFINLEVTPQTAFSLCSFCGSSAFVLLKEGFRIALFSVCSPGQAQPFVCWVALKGVF